MDSSVDSIGTCSLDVEASANFSDQRSENSSTGTLRSFAPSQEVRLPSYLSLACTVNGYSTTTNYNPERLGKSRDSSPHRPQEHESVTYTVRNNLLSPPNLVPLPMQKYRSMAEETQFYSSAKTVASYKATTLFTKEKCVEVKYRNGSAKTIEEYGDVGETKSFIQQRVERLYGPGALAQGFFVMRRQKNRLSESEEKNHVVANDKHSKSMSDKLLDDEVPTNIRQCTSSPSLPVLRHLTPEFRAQLPLFSPRRGNEATAPMQKSSTVPALKDEVNGHTMPTENGTSVKPTTNGCHVEVDVECPIVVQDNDATTKDGHYFLKVLERETTRLLALAEGAEQHLNTEGLNEDAKGFLRSASGKARLLVSQKMQQFKGLCTNNITQVEGEAFPTTNEDLQGFWDMVMLQVDQVDALYKELEVLKSNNWVEVKKPLDVVDKPSSSNGKPRKLIVPRAQTSGAEEARKKREAQRKQMIEERRKAMREQKQTPRQSIEIYMPETS